MPGNDAQLLEKAVREAGARALELYNASPKKWKKSDGTPVTEADIAVDNMLKETLTSARPDYGWLSEETADSKERLERQRVWIVDPIDGTRSFVERTGQWCVAAALVENGKPILSCIFRPLQNDFYFAQTGRGAFVNGIRLTVGNRSGLKDARIMARPRVLAREKWQVPFPRVSTDILNSLVLRICKVADASFDATIAFGDKSDWDLAPGELVLSEAGGQATNTSGQSFVYNQPVTRQTGGLIAAGKQTHKLIMAHKAK